MLNKGPVASLNMPWTWRIRELLLVWTGHKLDLAIVSDSTRSLIFFPNYSFVLKLFKNSYGICWQHKDDPPPCCRIRLFHGGHGSKLGLGGGQKMSNKLRVLIVAGNTKRAACLFFPVTTHFAWPRCVLVVPKHTLVQGMQVSNL
jgi:hypothetical protein